MLTLHKVEHKGIYKVAIADVKLGESNNDKKTPFVQFTYTILEAPNAHEVGHTIPFQKFYHTSEFGEKQLIGFIEAATGETLPTGVELEINEQELIQAVLTVKLEQDQFGTKTVAWFPADAYDKHADAQMSRF